MFKKTFIIIPTYNEKENIKNLIQEIFNLELPEINILIIDDNSPDRTGEIVNSLTRKYKNLKLIKRNKKLGLGSAYKLGFKYALGNKADLIMTMDADFSHNPKDIPKFIKESNEFDVVVGSRRIPGGKIIGWNIWRKISSWLGANVSRIILGIKVKDPTSGFRCYKKSILEKIDFKKIRSQGYAFQGEILLLCQKNKAKIKEIPITFENRKKGKSKFGFKEIFEFIKFLIRTKCQRRGWLFIYQLFYLLA